jgi:hypothetical protein
MASRRRRNEEKAPKKAQARTSLAPLAPLAATAGLALLTLTHRVQESAALVRSFWAAVVVLAVFHAALFLRIRRKGEPARRFLYVEPRAQHYVQAVVQLSVFAYWGYYFRPVYDHAWLLVAQLLFAYAFDMLLVWTRRDAYPLGFGPFPILFSTNLFLWFRDDWFYLQFVMIAVGFLGKEFVRWERDGRRVHVFNPSAFSLSLFSLVLLVTGTTELTWGKEIATTLSFAPHIYLFLFGIGLVVMYFFSITLVAASAAVVLFGASALYSAATGVPYFIDSEIPTAVFLGLHLLVTDPSTSPRTPPGKLLFGVLYGLGVVALYALLGGLGAPTFYDKLLCVPLLNLSVRFIDRLVRETSRNGLGLSFEPARANLAFMAVWIAIFAGMTGVGATDGTHRGDMIPFWEEACAEGRRNACDRLLAIEASYCSDRSGWACNELGLKYREGRLATADPERALDYFSRSCETRFQAGCINLLSPDRLARANPRPLDLRLLLREGGANLMEMPERELYAKACSHRWTFACPSAASGGGP